MTQMLYTKYRPNSLKEVLNQEEVTNVLLKSIENKSPASAYIFTGGRGIGKTSIARAFAKDLGINEADITEMDAASNNGVDNMRDLTQNTYSLPFLSKYKMYIFDEVHMFSSSAFNAFLKILEEPPAHVIFVLATTHPQKLPDTILSRCLQFTLKKPNLNQIQNYLKTVAEKEDYLIEATGLRSIAILGDGSYRDSLAHLQKVLSANSSDTKKEITEDEVNKILNIAPLEVVINYVKALDTKDEVLIKLSLLNLRKLENDNSNILFFTKNVLHIARILLLYRFGSINLKEIENLEGDFVAKNIEEMSQNKTPKLLSYTLSKLIEIQNQSNNISQILSFEILLLE